MEISRRNALSWGAVATAASGAAIITAPAASAAEATPQNTSTKKRPLSCPMGKGK
ncbi:hypothetical protein [Kocuria sp. HSID16901]|uniref:hypothetical protein n=1 Tax=Kocuria sp. HSID16901 TaxID=2419505 RepID=UPI00129403FF|nr:hypothetical protein [Kocuria sp. HSID16901]MCT1367687.1 hypothetical protein [Rothia sp. p3-SID1597]